jgi:hypothetical protein
MGIDFSSDHDDDMGMITVNTVKTDDVFSAWKQAKEALAHVAAQAMRYYRDAYHRAREASGKQDPPVELEILKLSSDNPDISVTLSGFETILRPNSRPEFMLTMSDSRLDQHWPLRLREIRRACEALAEVTTDGLLAKFGQLMARDDYGR